MTIEKSIEPEVVKEIERKFKVKSLPENLASFPKKEIRQGYISVSEDGVEVRIRQKDDKFYKTEKSGLGVVREENEIEISQEEFKNLWLETKEQIVEKTRYEISLSDGHLAELDIYQGDLEGLMVVEVEFADENSALEFVPPEWFGEDISNDITYKNFSLAVHGNPEKKEEQTTFELEEGVDFLKKEIEAKKNEQVGPLIILIAGGSASGKTSAVADKIHKAFTEESIILSLDDYYKGLTFIKAKAEEGIYYNFDQPEVINLELFNEHLTALKNGQTIEKPIYNFKIGEADKTERIDPKKIIIVEGLFALNQVLLEVGDIKVFVEVGTHGRLVRRILRDIESRGKNPDDILDYFAKVVEPMHNEHIQNTKENADIVISNEYNPEVEARGMKEMQLKFKADISPEFLRKLGAERISSSLQVDTYYNPKDRDLLKTGEALRTREENGKYIVTYKGPNKGGDFRIRPKIDFEIDQKTKDIFVNMYSNNVNIVTKDRTLYQLDGVTFSLDKVVKNILGVETDLGNFVEIRGVNSSTQNALTQVIEKLGLNISDGDKRAYSEM